MGMSLHAVILKETVTYQNTAAKALFSLPPGTIPLFAIVQVETAFNDSGTDLLTLGKGADGDYFASGIDLSTAGGKLVMLNQSAPLTAKAGVTATYTGQNGNATAGRAIVLLVCGTPFDPA